MNGKFVIQNRKTEKWVNLDYREGSEIIYTEKFLSAYKFDTKKRALDFLEDFDLNIKKHELFQLSVMARPMSWK